MFRWRMQLVLFLLRQRAALGDGGQPGDDAFVDVIFALLLGAERDEVIAVGAFGQFGFHVGLAAAQHEGLDALRAVCRGCGSRGAAAVVQFVILAVEPEQRAEQGRVEEIHQRIQFVDAVLDGRAGEDEGVAAAQAFDGLGGFGAPVLDALGFVQHHDVRPQPRVDVQRVGQHLLVIDDGEERQRPA